MTQPAAPAGADDHQDVRASLIFISYSRADFGLAVPLSERLKQDYGPSSVFLDADAIRPGTDWLKSLNLNLRGSLLLLCLIGKDWTKKASEASDYVRQEIECALSLDMGVLPVLLEGVEMPASHELPDSLSRIVGIQVEYLRSKTLRRDLDAIAGTVRELLLRQCNFDPQLSVKDWDEGRRHQLLATHADLHARPFGFNDLHQLMGASKRSASAHLQLGMRYLIGIGPRANTSLAEDHLRAALTTADVGAIEEFSSLWKAGAIPEELGWKIVESLPPGVGDAIHSRLGVESLARLAKSGRNDAVDKLRALADSGDPAAIRQMSEIEYLREINQFGREPVAATAAPPPARSPDKLQPAEPVSSEAPKASENSGCGVIFAAIAGFVAGFIAAIALTR